MKKLTERISFKKTAAAVFAVIILLSALCFNVCKKLSPLESKLHGKNFSVLGDSISTYEGFSDNAEINSTLGANVTFSRYKKSSNELIASVNETWWMKSVNNTKMNLLVNNSWGGSRVLNSENAVSSGWNTRADNLHSNTGKKSGTTPDVIAVFIGINDFNHNMENTDFLGAFPNQTVENAVSNKNCGNFTYAAPATFTDAYTVMLHKIINNYPSADVFCFTLLPLSKEAFKHTDVLKQYNETIKQIADYFKLNIVDLYEICNLTEETIYTCMDSKWCHPGTEGMKMISDVFIQSLQNFYLS